MGWNLRRSYLGGVWAALGTVGPQWGRDETDT
jgi:hypothetical protein